MQSFREFLHYRWQPILGGIGFGVWTALLYVFSSQGVNYLLMPGFPLEPPEGGWVFFTSKTVLITALIGLISAVPNYSLGGAALAAFLLATVNSISNYLSMNLDASMTFASYVLMLYIFLPLVTFYIPIAFIIRLGADALYEGRYHLTRMPVWVKISIISLFVLVVGSFYVYSPDNRNAMVHMRYILQQGMSRTADEPLPGELKDVLGFKEQAVGDYRISWSDDARLFLHIFPDMERGLYQNIIVVRFENGYRIYCNYRSSPGVCRSSMSLEQTE
jgi:hypothetical protein